MRRTDSEVTVRMLCGTEKATGTTMTLYVGGEETATVAMIEAGRWTVTGPARTEGEIFSDASAAVGAALIEAWWEHGEPAARKAA